MPVHKGADEPAQSEASMSPTRTKSIRIGDSLASEIEIRIADGHAEIDDDWGKVLRCCPDGKVLVPSDLDERMALRDAMLRISNDIDLDLDAGAYTGSEAAVMGRVGRSLTTAWLRLVRECSEATA
jgi:hypothetical protein